MTYEYENLCFSRGFVRVAGVDEAGRGPLAGPVFAGAVILPAGLEDIGLNDSKKLTEKKRDILFDLIRENAVSYGVGMATEQEIDALNILNATFLAMKRAVEALELPPDVLLIDGNRPPRILQNEITVIKGDAKVISIAAASVLAKVSRDRYMQKLSEQYPQYEFDKHKGYPTKRHYELILEHGVSAVHRRSFLKNLDEHR